MSYRSSFDKKKMAEGRKTVVRCGRRIIRLLQEGMFFIGECAQHCNTKRAVDKATRNDSIRTCLVPHEWHNCGRLDTAKTCK